MSSLKTIIKICIGFTLFGVELLNAQSFREITEFHENGQPSVEIIKNSNLEITKRNEFDINGKLIAFFHYDPETTLKNGLFMEGSNKGFYNQNVLNCDNCEISMSGHENNYNSKIVFSGKFTDGKPQGQIEVYKLTEKQELVRDKYTSYLFSLEFNRRINYSRYVGTGIYNKNKLMTLHYNEKGNLDGVQQISSYTKLKFSDGVLLEVLTKNSINKSIYKDSISRDFKILKIDNKYYKNIGWLKELSWKQYQGEQEVLIEYPKEKRDYNVFFGNNNTQYSRSTPMAGIIYGGVGELNENGIYNRVYDESDLIRKRIMTYSGYKDFSISHLFYEIPLYQETLSPLGSDIEIKDFFNGEPLLPNSTGLSFNRELETITKNNRVNSTDFYKVFQRIIDSPNTPFLQVYLNSNGTYDTYRAVHSKYSSEIKKREKEKAVAKKRREAEIKRLYAINIEIEQANLQYVISKYYSFIGNIKDIENVSKTPTFEQWTAIWNQKTIETSTTRDALGSFKYKYEYGNDYKTLILFDKNSNSGSIYNYKNGKWRRSKFDNNDLSKTMNLGSIIPEINYLKNATYLGVKEIENERKQKERAYVIETNYNEKIYYSVNNYRKIKKTNSDNTTIFYMNWQHFKGVKLPHIKKAYDKDLNSIEYSLDKIESNPKLSKKYFKKAKF